LVFYSCYRTYEEQAALSAKNPDTTTTALAGTSAHHTGRAIDFADPTRKITASSAFYKWLVANASKYGFYPYNVEAHHWNITLKTKPLFTFFFFC
jgi:LAS superfamily LD-carboxypeptidase LdcB